MTTYQKISAPILNSYFYSILRAEISVCGCLEFGKNEPRKKKWPPDDMDPKFPPKDSEGFRPFGPCYYVGQLFRKYVNFCLSIAFFYKPANHRQSKTSEDTDATQSVNLHIQLSYLQLYSV